MSVERQGYICKSCIVDFFPFLLLVNLVRTFLSKRKKPSVFFFSVLLRSNDLLIDVIQLKMASGNAGKSSILKNVVYDSRNDVPTGKKRAGIFE